MLTGQNGILNRAAEAKSKTEVAQKEETDRIAKMEAMTQTADTPVTNPESYGTNSNAQATADGAGKYFAKPEGATYVEGTVDTGVVVNIKGSEFVWVPVEDVVLDSTMEENLPKKASDWNKDTSKTPMAVKVGENYKGILYDYSENNEAYLMYPNKKDYQGISSDFREPDTINYYDGKDSDTVNGKTTIDKLTSEYNAMLESVIKYKGFYVSRYEAGLDRSTHEIVFRSWKNNSMTTEASNGYTPKWYGLYSQMKSFTTDSDKVVSSMIWGSQYDAMMNWMTKSGKKIGVIDDSNYYNYNNLQSSGSRDKDIINNIYDLYGCHYEWTLEAEKNEYRVARGGYFQNGSAPATRRGCAPHEYNINNSTRATLYIK